MDTIKKMLFLCFILLASLCPIFSESTVAASPGTAHYFDLPDIFDGSVSYTLDDYRGKVLLLNIWASWCSGCKKEMPLFQKVQDAYRNKGFSIVTVNIDNKKERALNFLTKLERKMGAKVSFTVLYDRGKELAGRYNPFGLPASYLIDPEGNLIRTFPGSFDTTNLIDLTTAIDQALGSKQ